MKLIIDTAVEKNQTYVRMYHQDASLNTRENAAKIMKMLNRCLTVTSRLEIYIESFDKWSELSIFEDLKDILKAGDNNL